MKRIKIIDVPHYETDPKVIVEQLTDFLKTFRKNKLAADLIGEDERSAEFDVSDFDVFASELSECQSALNVDPLSAPNIDPLVLSRPGAA